MQPPSQDDTQPSIQFANQPQFQQLQPQMMLCPVQFIYEPQVMVPPEEHVPPNQTPTFQNPGFLLNVQNTPPWIQNRPNMVYMPQVQMNMQPYIPQQMVQNPMYNYQYQPMIMHEQMRHIPYMNQSMMQSPQIMQSVVQTPQNIPQSMMQSQPHQTSNVMNPQNIIQSPMRLQMEQKQESPLLNQMLQNNAPKQAQSQPDYMPPMVMRPQYQTVRPQMIVVNPIAPTHTCMRQKEPATAEKPKEIPLHIKPQIPEGLNVKTMFKLSSTAMVRPTNELPNIAPVDEAHPRVYPKPIVKPPSNRDPQTNYKRKIREIIEQNNKDETEAQMHKRSYLANKQEIINKVNGGLVVNAPTSNFATQTVPIRTQNEQIKTQQDQTTSTDRLQVNDKMLRNTVYVQARGIVNEPPKNDMQHIENNQNILQIRLLDPIEKESNIEVSGNSFDAESQDEERNSQNENENQTAVTQDDSEMTEPLAVNGDVIQNGSKMTESLPNIDSTLSKLTITPIPIDANRNKLTKLVINIDSDDVKVQKNKIAEFNNYNHTNKINNQNNKMTLLSHDNESDDTKVQKNLKITQFLHSDDVDGTLTRNNSKMTEILLSKNESKSKKEPKNREVKTQKEKSKRHKTDKVLDATDTKIDKTEMYVLTHVLDGYIIQESNVPFLIAKPSLTRKKKTNIEEITPPNNLETEITSNISPGAHVAEKTLSGDKTDSTQVETKEDIILIELKLEEENSQRNEDNPFEHLSMATVKSWTVADLSTYLMDYDTWQESAQKLLEEEIDGESLLLVNKEQLIQIGICEDHADVLCAFLERDASNT